MSIMSTRNRKDCPEVHLIEAYISNQIPSTPERVKISHHLKSCPHCQALASELKLYYTILEQERKRPVPSSAFKIVKEIEQEKVIVAGILLQPNEVQDNQKSKQFQSGIVLISHNDDAESIDDLDCIPIDEEEIFIRAIQSQTTLETTLFLFAHNEKLYRNVQLQIESGEEIFSSDLIGKIEFGNFDINNLDDKHIIITPEGA